jgi:hypothetical protein
MKLIASLFVVSVGSAGLSPGAPALADAGFRCGSGRLVNVGDGMYEVRTKCGDPDQATQRVEKRRIKVKLGHRAGASSEEVSEEHDVEILIDEWVYDLGPERFIRTVSFENSRVTDVATGGRGVKQR